MNYNQVEKGNRKLHIDNNFDEVDSMKIATFLDYNIWNELLDTKNLEVGDIVILSLPGNSRRRLNFKLEPGGSFIYSFNIF